MKTLTLVAFIFTVGGCHSRAPKASTTPASIIEAAGVASANTAKITPSSSQRGAITSLGSAYLDTRAAYEAVLAAETQYHAAVNSQILACMPASINPQDTIASTGSSATCSNAAKHSAASKTLLDNANAALTEKIGILRKKIAAVKL